MRSTPTSPRTRAGRTPDATKAVVRATRESLRGKPDENGLLRSSGDGVVPVTVGHSSIPRTIGLLEAIAAAVREAGGALAVRPGDPYPAYGQRARSRGVLELDGSAFQFSIVEECDRTAHVPTQTELRESARSSWYRIPEWDKRPSGRLAVKIDGGPSGPKPRERFADGVRATVEDKVSDLVAELVERARLATQRREEAARADERYAIARRAAVERAREAHLEDLRANHAREQAARWADGTKLRDFAAAMRLRSPDADQVAWLEWIESYADRIDPPTGVRSPKLPETLHDWELGDRLRAWPVTRPHHWSD